MLKATLAHAPHDQILVGRMQDDRGMLSSAKVFEITPSMKDPVMNGIEYTVIRKELCKGCPRLMSVQALLAMHRQPTRASSEASVAP